MTVDEGMDSTDVVSARVGDMDVTDILQLQS